MSRIVVVLGGGHAAGKTTFCKTLEEVVDPNKVAVIYGDLDNRFKGTTEEKVDNLVDLLADEDRHIVFEGMRAPVGLYDTFVKSCDQLVLVVACMSADRMLANLKHRCAKNNKEFSAKQQEYWTPKKLHYEANTRHLNIMKRLASTYPDRVPNITLRVVRHSDDPMDFSAFAPELVYLSKLLR